MLFVVMWLTFCSFYANICIMEAYSPNPFLSLTVRHAQMFHLGDLQTEHEDILEKYGLIETAEYHLGEHAASLTQLTRVSVAYTTCVNRNTGEAVTEPSIRFATPDFDPQSSKLRAVDSIYDPVGRIEDNRIIVCRDYSSEDVDRVLDMLDAIHRAGFPFLTNDMVAMLPTKSQKS